MAMARPRNCGAMRHLKNPVDQSLTTTQVPEVLPLMFSFLCMSWFLETGQAISKAENEPAPESGDIR